jgi:hypothetical protein
MDRHFTHIGQGQHEGKGAVLAALCVEAKRDQDRVNA